MQQPSNSTSWTKRWLPYLTLPIAIPVAAASVFVIISFLIIIVPVSYLRTKVHDFAFRKRVRQGGWLAELVDIIPQLESHSGTLLVEFGHKLKITSSLWIDKPMEELPALQTIITWMEFENPHKEIFSEGLPADSEGLFRHWLAEHFPYSDASLKILMPALQELKRLTRQAKESILVAFIDYESNWGVYDYVLQLCKQAEQTALTTA